jgi:proteasome lid subunit RPN8/RPN11
MSFCIKATIRAFVAPEHVLSCADTLWRQILSELEHRTEQQHESGAFLLGVLIGGRREVREAIFYDDLDPCAYASGVCVLQGDAFARLWSICRGRKLTVLADAHTHPHDAFQSQSDRTNPMVARDGHVAIIVPNFARPPVRTQELGIFEYAGQHEWLDRGPNRTPGYFYTGFWS